MPTFIIRANCEYSIEIKAETEDAAIEKAQDIDIQTWNMSWSVMEIEEDDG